LFFFPPFSALKGMALTCPSSHCLLTLTAYHAHYRAI
jgi:hypothetical protein